MCVRLSVCPSVTFVCLTGTNISQTRGWGGKHFLIGGGNAHDGVDEKMDVS